MNARTPATRPRGRPVKRSPKLAKRICDCVAKGMPFKMVCGVAGISQNTLAVWRRDDPVFAARVEQAVAKGVQKRLAVVHRAMRSADQAIALRASCWWLEHIHPEHFSRSRVEVTGADGGPLAGAVAIVLPAKIQEPPAVTVAALPERNNGNPT